MRCNVCPGSICIYIDSTDIKKTIECEIYITNIETTSLHPTEGGFIIVGGGFLCNPNLSYCFYQSLDSVAGGVGSVLVGLINENRCFPKKTNKTNKKHMAWCGSVFALVSEG